MRTDIVADGRFADYELTDTEKQRRKPSELQGGAPRILILARGHFSPKDKPRNRELAAFYAVLLRRRDVV